MILSKMLLANMLSKVGGGAKNVALGILNVFPRTMLSKIHLYSHVFF